MTRSRCPQHPYPSPLCLVQEVERSQQRGETILGYVNPDGSGRGNWHARQAVRRRSPLSLWPELLAIVIAFAAIALALIAWGTH